MLARVQRLVPFVRRVTGRVRTLAATSAGSALVLWGIAAAPWRWVEDGAGAATVVLAFVGLGVLLAPAGVTLLGVLALDDFLAMPGRLRASASETLGHARAAVAPAEAEDRPRRAVGFFRAVWSARSLVLDTRDVWLRAAAMARLGWLASLPFVLVLLVAFALNVVIVFAAVLVVAAVLIG